MNLHHISEKFSRKIREALSKLLLRDVFYLQKLLFYHPTNSVNKNKNHSPQGRCIALDAASDVSRLLIYRKIPKISPGAYIFKRPFLKGLFLEGLSTEENLRFKIDLASLIATLYLGAISGYKPPGGLIFGEAI